MNFGPRHYVPVLKLKRGEKAALELLGDDVVGDVTPLIEVNKIDSKKPKSLMAHLKTCFNAKLPSILSRFRRCLLDARDILPSGEAGARAVFETAARLQITFTPVTGISRNVDVAPALELAQHGLALRLTPEDFRHGAIRRTLPRFLVDHHLDPAQVDLIIDLATVDKMVPIGVVNMARAFLGDVRDPQNWRTLSLIGCSMPTSMSFIGRDADGATDRAEFRAWRDHLYTNRKGMTRLPTFGDYGIHHLGGNEDLDFSKIPFSPTIRYARDSAWLILRGHSSKHEHPSKQIPVLSRGLVRGRLSGNFDGTGHCAGCAGAVQAAAAVSGTCEAWVKIGTIHHITNTVRQIQSLSWP